MQLLYIQIQSYVATTCFGVIHAILRELCIKTQQITQALQLCYIVLTANVEHVGFENCVENNICMYFT